MTDPLCTDSRNEWEKCYEAKGQESKKETVDSSDVIDMLNIQSDDIVLDVGCGNGAHLGNIQRITESCVGIDFSRQAMKYRRINRIILADMRNIPFKDSQFTKAFSLGAVEHVAETRDVLMEIRRVTKPKALSLITVPNKRSFFHLNKLLTMQLKRWKIGYEKSFYPENLLKLLTKMQFSVTRYKMVPSIPTVPPSKLSVRKVWNTIVHSLDLFLNSLNSKKFGFFIYVLFINEKTM